MKVGGYAQDDCPKGWAFVIDTNYHAAHFCKLEMIKDVPDVCQDPDGNFCPAGQEPVDGVCAVPVDTGPKYEDHQSFMCAESQSKTSPTLSGDDYADMEGACAQFCSNGVDGTSTPFFKVGRAYGTSDPRFNCVCYEECSLTARFPRDIYKIKAGASFDANCEGAWSEFDACSAPCGSGTQISQFEVSTPRAGDGFECFEGDAFITDSFKERDCNPDPCDTCSKKVQDGVCKSFKDIMPMEAFGAGATELSCLFYCETISETVSVGDLEPGFPGCFCCDSNVEWEKSEDFGSKDSPGKTFEKCSTGSPVDCVWSTPGPADCDARCGTVSAVKTVEEADGGACAPQPSDHVCAHGDGGCSDGQKDAWEECDRLKGAYNETQWVVENGDARRAEGDEVGAACCLDNPADECLEWSQEYQRLKCCDGRVCNKVSCEPGYAVVGDECDQRCELIKCKRDDDGEVDWEKMAEAGAIRAACVLEDMGDCQTWFDGCNECTRRGGLPSCTKKYCSAYAEPKCKD